MSCLPDANKYKFETHVLSAMNDSDGYCMVGMRSAMSSSDFFHLLERTRRIFANTESPEVILALLRQHPLRADRCVANFSSRFQAIVMRWNDSYVWFTRIERKTFVFSLSKSPKPDKELCVTHCGQTERIPSIYVPPEGITWTDLQQQLIDDFIDDDHVRAILAAAVLSYRYEGNYCCVLNQLIPSDMCCFGAKVKYDVPIDDDILTVLADPRITEAGRLYFDCADGYCASVIHRKYVSHLVRMARPKKSRPFVESSSCLMPFLYGGYGSFIENRQDPERTIQVAAIFDRLESGSKLSRLLKMVMEAAPELKEDGQLDLTTAASVLAQSQGAILGRPKHRLRRIIGPVVIIGKDGLYKSNRFNNHVLEGSFEANFLVFRAGLRSRQVFTNEDTRLCKLSEVCDYLMDVEYKPRLDYRYMSGNQESSHIVFAPPLDPFTEEAAVANTIAALVSRKFNLFCGFASCAASSKHVNDSCARNVKNDETMDANVFLPVLRVFADPKRELRIRSEKCVVNYTWVWEIIICSWLLSLFIPPITGEEHPKFCHRMLMKFAYGKTSYETRRVGRTTVVIRNNPFFRLRRRPQDQIVEVFANI